MYEIRKLSENYQKIITIEMAILELELYIEWKHNFFNKINENGILKFRVHGITLKFKIIYYM